MATVQATIAGTKMDKPETAPSVHESLKEKLKSALRKTGHVAEGALDAVATVAIETTTGLGESER